MTGTWDSFAKRLSAAPTAGRGAHPAAVDAWTEALTLAGGADSCDIKSLVQKRDAPGKAETALQSKAQQRRLQHAMIGNAVAGFGKVQILTSEAELELESDGEVDEEYAWTSRGPFAARMYCSLAKELWCCGRRRRARAAAQEAVSVNPWCFEAISLLDQWNPRRVRRSSSARSVQALQQGHAATSLTPRLNPLTQKLDPLNCARPAPKCTRALVAWTARPAPHVRTLTLVAFPLSRWQRRRRRWPSTTLACSTRTTCTSCFVRR